MNIDMVKLLTVGAMMTAQDMYVPTVHKWKPEAPHKCALPGCDKLTTRGYCCAEHCKAHKQLLRERIRYASVSCQGKAYCGWRHHRIESEMVARGYVAYYELHNKILGFATDRDRIVSPAQARAIAVRAGQIPADYYSDELYSTDLWDDQGNKLEKK